MSLAVAQGTSLFIIMRRAQIEYRLMQITDQLARLAYNVADETTALMNQFQRQVAADAGTDDVSAVAAEVMTSADFNALYTSITARYQAKERILTNEKKQLETQEKALETESEGIDKMIESGIKQSFGYFNH